MNESERRRNQRQYGIFGDLDTEEVLMLQAALRCARRVRDRGRLHEMADAATRALGHGALSAAALPDWLKPLQQAGLSRHLYQLPEDDFVGVKFPAGVGLVVSTRTEPDETTFSGGQAVGALRVLVLLGAGSWDNWTGEQKLKFLETYQIPAWPELFQSGWLLDVNMNHLPVEKRTYVLSTAGSAPYRNGVDDDTDGYLSAFFYVPFYSSDIDIDIEEIRNNCDEEDLPALADILIFARRFGAGGVRITEDGNFHENLPTY